MKAKIISILLFCLLIYVLPLLPKMDLITSWPLLILMLSCVVLFSTQPPLTFAESNANQQRDRSSIWIIMVAVALTQLSTVLEWAYWQSDFLRFRWDWTVAIGLLLLVGGTVFRIWCIQILGRYFTATVRTQDQQPLIQTAAYKYLRHPSYLGAFLAILGSTLLMHAYFSFALSFVLMFSAYHYRIEWEEKTLVENFGQVYLEYRSRTSRLFPYLY